MAKKPDSKGKAAPAMEINRITTSVCTKLFGLNIVAAPSAWSEPPKIADPSKSALSPGQQPSLGSQSMLSSHFAEKNVRLLEEKKRLSMC
jgi:CCR4-NOT transcription complex subunit 3